MVSILPSSINLPAAHPGWHSIETATLKPCLVELVEKAAAAQLRNHVLESRLLGLG